MAAGARWLGNLAALAGEDVHGDNTIDVVRRAMAVAEADGARMKDLILLLNAAQSHASSTSSTSHDQLQRLETEAAEIMNLLAELKSIQRDLNAETRFTAIAPKLASLAAWQECVLNNTLIARMRLHEGAGLTAPTATQFVERQRPIQTMPLTQSPTQQSSYHIGHSAPARQSLIAPMRTGPCPAYSRPGFVVPRQYRLDNKIEMHGGGANAHDGRR